MKRMKLKAVLTAAMAAGSAGSVAFGVALMRQMRTKGALAVAMMAAGGAALAQVTGTGTGRLGPYDMSVSYVSGSATTTPFSPSASTLAEKKRQAYLAAAGMAANFLQTGGEAPVPPILREVLETEKEIVRQVRGPKAAARLCDLDLAQYALWRVEELKQKG